MVYAFGAVTVVGMLGVGLLALHLRDRPVEFQLKLHLLLVATLAIVTLVSLEQALRHIGGSITDDPLRDAGPILALTATHLILVAAGTRALRTLRSMSGGEGDPGHEERFDQLRLAVSVPAFAVPVSLVLVLGLRGVLVLGPGLAAAVLAATFHLVLLGLLGIPFAILVFFVLGYRSETQRRSADPRLREIIDRFNAETRGRGVQATKEALVLVVPWVGLFIALTFVGPSPDSYVGSLLLAGAAFFVIAIPLWRGLRDAYQTLLQDLTITDDDLRTLNRGNAAGIVSGLLATAGILAFFLAMGPAWRILGPGPPSIASIHSVESVIPETFLAGMGAVAATGFLMVGTYMILLPSLQARLVPLPLMWFVTYVSNSIAVAILDVGVRWSLLGDPLPSGSEWFGVLGLSLVGTIAGEHSLAPLEPHFSRIREDYIRCPTEGCGEQVNLRSDYCKSCGAEIPDERGEVLRSDNGLSEDPAP